LDVISTREATGELQSLDINVTPQEPLTMLLLLSGGVMRYAATGQELFPGSAVACVLALEGLRLTPEGLLGS
jgi:hypothetical protein